MDAEHRLRAYLRERFRSYSDEVGVDEDLGGVVDSLGLFDIVEFVEREFGVAIGPNDFTTERFSSIREILTLIGELTPPSPRR